MSRVGRLSQNDVRQREALFLEAAETAASRVTRAAAVAEPALLQDDELVPSTTVDE